MFNIIKIIFNFIFTNKSITLLTLKVKKMIIIIFFFLKKGWASGTCLVLLGLSGSTWEEGNATDAVAFYRLFVLSHIHFDFFILIFRLAFLYKAVLRNHYM